MRLKEFGQNRRHTQVVYATLVLVVLLLASCVTNRTEDLPVTPIDPVAQLDARMIVFQAVIDEGILSESDRELVDKALAAIELVHAAIEAGRDGHTEIAAANTAIAVVLVIKAIREAK